MWNFDCVHIFYLVFNAKQVASSHTVTRINRFIFALLWSNWIYLFFLLVIICVILFRTWKFATEKDHFEYAKIYQTLSYSIRQYFLWWSFWCRTQGTVKSTSLYIRSQKIYMCVFKYVYHLWLGQSDFLLAHDLSHGTVIIVYCPAGQ